jgi:hypothetical protein
MKLYRFSPVINEASFHDALQHIHISCSQLCIDVMGKCLPNSGNIGFFCHYDDEYEALTKLRQSLTHPSDNPQQKYFKLYKPIVFEASENIPATTYTHLYIRKPDPYRHHVGDVDFYLSQPDYVSLRARLSSGERIRGARIFPRQDLDMVELYNPDIDCLGYISTDEMTQKVHVNQGQSNL